MQEAFIKNAQHKIDDEQGGENENGLAVQRRLESTRRAGKNTLNIFRKVQLVHRLRDSLGGLGKGDSGRNVEGKGQRCKLPLMRCV